MTPNLNMDKIGDLYMKLYKKYHKLDIIKLYTLVKSFEIRSSLTDSIFLSNMNTFVDKIYNNLKNNKEYIDFQLKKLTNIKKTSSKNCFKNYTFIRYINEGHFGKTYLVKKNKKQYVIKTINLSRYLDPSRESRFKIEDINHEIENHLTLSKLGITPKIYEYYMCDIDNNPHVLIVMEYMNMGTLWDYLTAGNTFTKKMKVQLKKKIDLMHSKGIFHNDFHEQNILLHRNDSLDIEVYISDLGLSKSVEKMEQNNIPDLWKKDSQYKESLLKKIVIYDIIFNYID